MRKGEAAKATEGAEPTALPPPSREQLGNGVAQPKLTPEMQAFIDKDKVRFLSRSFSG